MITKSKFGKIIHKKEDKSISKILSALKKAESANYNLFKVKPSEYSVILTYSNSEYDKKAGLKSVKTHRGGYVVNNKIIILSPSIKKLLYDYESFFYHEINHIFYLKLVGGSQPVWFSEGMATFLMKTYKLEIKGWKKYFRSIKNPEKLLYYRYIKKKYYANAKEFYPLAFLTYRYLHLKFGEKKIMSFLKEYAKKPMKSNFDILFEKHFSKNLSKLVIDVIK